MTVADRTGPAIQQAERLGLVAEGLGDKTLARRLRRMARVIRELAQELEQAHADLAVLGEWVDELKQENGKNAS